MIMSVSTLIIGSGAATPVSVVNFCMLSLLECDGAVLRRRGRDAASTTSVPAKMSCSAWRRPVNAAMT